MIPFDQLENFIQTHITHRKESLLAPDLKQFNIQLSENINEKNVLVIGGAGTIGSWYIKALLKYKPRKLVVVDINENGLTELVRDLRSSLDYHIPETFITYPVNFSDPVFKKILDFHGPFHIVSNFAAHKHVRSEKDVFSIEAMIENNVFRTFKLIQQISETPVEHFFCVSTDKAANPVNIMGASKKLMEELLISYSSTVPITTARFANVAFSNGSLPAGFLERLSKKQPWSCPRNIRRFFVSPRESGELCLIASLLGNSGEIFFPKLDPDKDMISFETIAIDLLQHLGYTPDICTSEEEARIKAQDQLQNSNKYPIYLFDSDTSGEKPYEEFFVDDELLDLNRFQSLGVVVNKKPRPISEIEKIINQLNKLFLSTSITKSDVVEVLKQYLPNFSHHETGKGLDSKM
ncbi:MAG TPA: polysaccharide biosynthesis protein [Salinivirgaceae bacterium]|mgnify:CR=1 FL=1|nr:polysaccharide biosynthesis protein [Salinivirgaceae bacterium]